MSSASPRSFESAATAGLPRLFGKRGRDMQRAAAVAAASAAQNLPTPPPKPQPKHATAHAQPPSKKARAANLGGLLKSAGHVGNAAGYDFSSAGGGSGGSTVRTGAPGQRQRQNHGGMGPGSPGKRPRRKSARALLDTDAFSFEAWLREQWRFIPLRLDDTERGQLAVLRSAMRCSDYTDRVDVLSHKPRDQLVRENLHQVLCAVQGLRVGAAGLAAAAQIVGASPNSRHQHKHKHHGHGHGYGHNQQQGHTAVFLRSERFIRRIFEVGRRYKLMNPERMRTEYGKMMHILQDATDDDAVRFLGFRLAACPRRTVYGYIEEACAGLGDGSGSLNDTLARDPRLVEATRPVRNREEAVTKSRAARRLQEDMCGECASAGACAAETNSADTDGGGVVPMNEDTGPEIGCALPPLPRGALSADQVQRIVGSVSDAAAFVQANVMPCEAMLQHLADHFDPMEEPVGENEWRSLAITGGRYGARLTHSHRTQYHYVLQTLMLWREVTRDMFRLWHLAELDMLGGGGGGGGSSYRLSNTGQGLQRVQAAPRVAKRMRSIISKLQERLGTAPSAGSAAVQQLNQQSQRFSRSSGFAVAGRTGWVGSNVVHLGDHCVPNALCFMDKYAQIGRVLGPIVAALDAVDRIAAGGGSGAELQYIESFWGGCKRAKMRILVDFFRHAFDGSGADNSYDAGSCIDGRLTSAWNWCSRIEKKTYYPLFMLTGFTGFDGDFRDG